MLRFSLFDGHLDLAHAFWRGLLQPGDSAVDATCGNGHDTILLADLVGPSGKVIACDLQEEAIAATRDRLGDRPSVELIHGCHSELSDPCKLAVFNLGYLPGGDKERTTRVESTLASVEGLSHAIEAGGALSITCYPGHAEGAREEAALLEWGETLSPDQWSCSHQRWVNRCASPSLLLVQRAHSP